MNTATVKKNNNIDQEYMKLRRMLAGALGTTHGGTRDLYQVFGYDRIVKLDALQFMYDRNGIAERIIKAYPQATWRDMPLIRDDQGGGLEEDGDDYSVFASKTEKFFDRHKVLHYLERADRVSSIGRYGILLMGFGDGKELSEPLKKGRNKLVYLSCYGERNVKIAQWDENRKSARFGLPLMYRVEQNDLREVDGDEPKSRRSFMVHHSRVIHIAEFLDEDDVFGRPRLLSCFNWLQDLEKTTGGAAETFWLTANRGISIMADKEANLDEEEVKEINRQADALANSLQRHIVGRGMTTQVLGSEDPDPGPNVDKLLELISGAQGMPKRVLTGSERGELGGDNDEMNWAQRVTERRRNYASPMILRPFINVMILTGNLPRPKGQWWIEWPEEDLGPNQSAQVGLVKTQSLTTYANSPNASLIMPVTEFRTKIMGLEAVSTDDIEEELLLPEDDESQSSPPDDEQPEEEDPQANVNIAEKRSLYVCRMVKNAGAIIKWAESQGLKGIKNDLHVTVVYSEHPVSWPTVLSSSNGETENPIMIEPSRTKWLEWLGPEAAQVDGDDRVITICIKSPELTMRNKSLKVLGARDKWMQYQAHITIASGLPEGKSLSDLSCYKGAIVLGPEEYEEIKD